MASPTPETPGSYTLRAATSGPGLLDPRAALLLWGSGSIVLGITVSVLLIQGQIRFLVLLLLAVLGLACLAPRRGVYILLVFMPFMYFIRRLVLNFQEFDSRDPILIFPAVTSMFMFLGVLIFFNALLFRYMQGGALLKAVSLLMFYLGLEIFNPLQGNILVGLAGAMYFLAPMTWCFLGLLMTREDMARIFRIVIWLGFITALYGLYQHFVGLSAAEIYELKSKKFFKTFGSVDTVRIMSTFSSLGDFSLYLLVAAYLSFASFWRTKKKLFLLFIALLEVYTMVWMAVRTAFLLLAFSVTMFLVVKGGSRRQAVFRGALAVFVFTVVYGILGTYNPEKMYDQQFSTNPYIVHTLSGVTHPTQENTFQGRLGNWRLIVTNALTHDWVGHGLGSTTPAARKFEGGKQYETDSYFFELFYGSGLLAPILFAAAVFVCLKNLLTMCLERPDVYEYRVAMGLLCGAFLGSVFGGAQRDSITGPFLWLVIGWTLKEDLDGRWSRAAAAAQPR